MNPDSPRRNFFSARAMTVVALVAATGGAVLFLAGARTEPRDAAAQPIAAPLPSPVRPPENAQATRIALLRRRIAVLEAELAAARAQQAPLTPAPVLLPAMEPAAKSSTPVATADIAPLEFPPNVSAPHTPAEFQKIALESARSCGMGLDVFAIDCSEYPCIAWTKAMDPNVARFTMDGCAAWSTAFPKGTIVLGATRAGAGDAPEERYFGWMAAPEDPRMLQTAFKRAQIRAAEMNAALQPAP